MLPNRHIPVASASNQTARAVRCSRDFRQLLPFPRIACALVAIAMPALWPDRSDAGEPIAIVVLQDEPSTRPDGAGDENIARDDEVAPERRDGPASYRNEVIHGRVGWLGPALKERFGISTVSESADRVLAILTDDGRVIPLAENVRGRAFRKDDRLRDKPLELWVRRYEKQPFVQILKIVETEDGERYEVDYWCDICAIPMYETGPCSCCQDHNRIRKRPLDELEPSDLDSGDDVEGQ